MFATGCKLKQEPAAVETEEQSSNPKIGATSVASITPISIYGAWHASNDYCTWGAVRTVTEFDSKNHWLIDRGDGQPSVNLVVLSFVQPLKLLNKTTDSQTLNGIPRGMTQDIVNYFKNSNIRVTLSIESAHLYDAPERL
jgi:hypothetical protein